MDVLQSLTEFSSMVSMLLLLLLTCHRNLNEATNAPTVDDEQVNDALMFTMPEARPVDFLVIAEAAINHFRLWSGLAVVDEELGFWVKPRSTTWFTRFLLEEYEEQRWVQLFRMTKKSIFTLARILSPHIRRQDTNYRAAVPVVVRVACALFKLCHGASLLICSEMFAIRRSTVSIVLREVVFAINDTFRTQMAWPSREQLPSVIADFQSLCGMPTAAGVIDDTHFAIKKPRTFNADYYYYKSGAYAMHCQAVVDSKRRFLDIYIGMPGSTNDARVLRRSTLFTRGEKGTLWDGNSSFDGFQPFLLADSGYPLLPWIMVLHRRTGQLSMAELLFNRRLSKGRAVVENAFALLKSTFRELQEKLELSLVFLPDVANACALLHNVLLQSSHAEVESVLDSIQSDRPMQQLNRSRAQAGRHIRLPQVVAAGASEETRRMLGWYLSQQRGPPEMDEP